MTMREMLLCMLEDARMEPLSKDQIARAARANFTSSWKTYKHELHQLIAEGKVVLEMGPLGDKHYRLVR